MPAWAGRRLRVEWPESGEESTELRPDAEGAFEIEVESLRGGDLLRLVPEPDARDPASARDSATARDPVERKVPYLRVSLHPGDVVGNFQPGARVELRILDREGGTILGRGLAVAGDGGDFGAWLLDEEGRRLRPRPGQWVEAEDGLNRIALEIPELAARESQDAGQIEGEGLAGAPIELVLWNPWRPGETETPETLVDAEGRWSLAPKHGLHPATHFYVTERLASGDLLYLCRQIPMLYVSPGRPLVEVQALWEVEAELRLLREGREIARAEGGGLWSGNLLLVLRDAEGLAVPAMPGDLLRARLDGRWTEVAVEPLEAELEPAGSRIVGSAPVGAQVGLARPESPGESRVTVGAAGRFALPAGDWLDAFGTPPGKEIEVFYTSAQGHNMRRRWPGLLMRAELGGRLLEGRAEPGAKLRLLRRVEGGDEGADEMEAWADERGAWSAELPAGRPALEAGQRLRLEEGPRVLDLQLPELTIRLSADGRGLEGMAPPDALLDLAAYSAEGQPPTRLSAGADASGRWQVDLLDRGNGLTGVEANRLRRVELVWLGEGLHVWLALPSPGAPR
jgi:hypothetical protein